MKDSKLAQNYNFVQKCWLKLTSFTIEDNITWLAGEKSRDSFDGGVEIGGIFCEFITKRTLSSAVGHMVLEGVKRFTKSGLN